MDINIVIAEIQQYIEKNILSEGVQLPAQRLPVVAGGRDGEAERLAASARGGAEDIPQRPVAVGVDLIDE